MKKSISFIMLLCLCISNAFPGNLLAPPASNISLFERQSIIIDERERNRVIETFDKYISKVEYMTHVRYLLYRFFFEDIVGISFRELTLEDFISEAKILLLEYINRHPQSAVFPVQHVESNIITMCDAMAARHYALDAQEFIFWISRLKDAISTPSKKTLRERIILYRETLIALMARNKKDRIRLSEFISDSRKNNLLYTEADIGKSIPDFHHADPQDLARIDEFMHVLMGRFKKLSYNQKTVFSFGLGTEGPHLELKKSIAQFLNITVNRVAQTETFVRYELYQYFQHKLSKLLNTFDSENKDIPGQFKSERIKTFKRMMENQTPDEKNKNGNKFALFPYVHDTAPLVEWEKEDTPLREDPLTDQEEQEIMQWIKTELTIDQQLMLPLILQGASNNKIADQLHVTKKRVLYVKEKLLKKLRICFTIGYFNQYGSWEQVAEVMTFPRHSRCLIQFKAWSATRTTSRL